MHSGQFAIRAKFGARGLALAPRLHLYRLRISFAAIVAIGVTGALVVGGDRPSAKRAMPDEPAVTASIDGEPIQVSVPGIALIGKQLTALKSHERSPRSSR